MDMTSSEGSRGKKAIIDVCTGKLPPNPLAGGEIGFVGIKYERAQRKRPADLQ